MLIPIKKHDLGWFIRRCRKIRTMTQSQLADSANLSAAHISRIERGYENPSFFTVVEILDTLGLDVVIKEQRK